MSTTCASRRKNADYGAAQDAPHPSTFWRSSCLLSQMPSNTNSTLYRYPVLALRSWSILCLLHSCCTTLYFPSLFPDTVQGILAGREAIDVDIISLALDLHSACSPSAEKFLLHCAHLQFEQLWICHLPLMIFHFPDSIPPNFTRHEGNLIMFPISPFDRISSGLLPFQCTECERSVWPNKEVQERVRVQG